MVGGAANSVVESSTIHSAPTSARTRASVERATEPSKKAGWRTSTAMRCPSAPSDGRRRTNVASAPRSGGPNDAGSWTEICSARRAERGEQLEELPHLGVGVAQPSLVGDRAGQLEQEPEVVRRLLGPRRHRRRRRQAVERRVALDRVAPVGVGSQLLVLGNAVRAADVRATPGTPTSRIRPAAPPADGRRRGAIASGDGLKDYILSEVALDCEAGFFTPTRGAAPAGADGRHWRGRRGAAGGVRRR